MSAPKNVKDLITLHEGYRQFPYLCPAGKQTIGIGRNIEERGITVEEAEFLLQNDISDAIGHLRQEGYWLDLNEARQAILIDMVFNMGWTRFSKFLKMRAALSRHDAKAAADEMRDSAWYRQVGTRAKRLVRMMELGDWLPG